MKNSFAVAMLISVLCVTAMQAVAYTGQKLEKGAKIKLAQAQAIALKARPGKITDRELEKEKGGSGLRYSFDIRVNRATYEVGVDAQTGAILENGREGKNPD
ncbi:MAG: PepSY domain-containing protein [Alphaproteobacteria bacterium]|nr:PepSY domain-containing protein [Alphaproteobacteria bacterium]